MLKLGGLGNKLVHAFLMGVQGFCLNVDVKLKMKKTKPNPKPLCKVAGCTKHSLMRCSISFISDTCAYFVF